MTNAIKSLEGFMMKKFLVLIIGISLMALGTSICNTTGLGIDPFNALSVAFSDLFAIQLGTMVLLLQALLGIFVLVFDRKKLGLGSLVPMIAFGYFLQFFNWFIPRLIVVNQNWVFSVFIFFIGMLIIAIGMSTYMECEVGMVPYDCLSFVIGERINKNPFTFRIAIDITVAILAFVLGGPINIGTVLLAFFTGPLINYFRKKLPRQLFVIN